MLRIIVILAAIAGVWPTALADDSPLGDESPLGICEDVPPAGGPWRCGPRGRDLLLVSAAYSTAEFGDGDELTGVTLSAGLWDESQDMFGRVLYWAHLGRSDLRDYASVGANVGVLIIPMGPIRIVPEFKLGVAYSWETTDAAEVLPGIGLEVAGWLGSKYQVAVSLDRDFGSRTGTRNQLMLSIRWSPKHWTSGGAPPNNGVQRTETARLWSASRSYSPLRGLGR